jgi:transposase
MGTSKQKKVELAKRRKKVARLYLQGYSQRIIAEEVDMSVATVNRDLGIIKDRWQESALVDMDELMRRELARLDMNEQMLFEQLRQSGEPVEESTKEVKEALARTSQMKVTESGDLAQGKVTTDKQPTERKLKTRTKENLRDPRIWRHILRVQEKRRQLLGMYDYEPKNDGSRMEKMVEVMEKTREEVDMGQFEDEEIR